MDIITTNSTVYGTEIKSFNDYIYKHSIEINKLWDEEIIDEILANISDNSDILDIGANIPQPDLLTSLDPRCGSAMTAYS